MKNLIGDPAAQQPLADMKRRLDDAIEKAQ